MRTAWLPADGPVRIDLWGDEVDRLTEFSVSDQRATEPVAGVVTSALWIGILALVYGIFQIMASFRIRKLAK